MRRLLPAVLVVSVISIACQRQLVATTQGESPAEAARPILLQPDDITWTGAPEGMQTAVLEGDPSKGGPYTQRLRFPDGARIKPHTRPNLEHVLVLEGTFHLGFGNKFSKEEARGFPAGSYIVLPPDTPHFAYAEGVTVLQTHGIGPSATRYIDQGSRT